MIYKIECNYSSYHNTSPKEEQNWKTQKIIWNVKETECIIPLICDWPNRPKQKVCYETGKAAQTEYEVLEYAEDNTARVRLKPITGRSHQLRVHMLALGHPILGDRFYATPEALAMAPRLLLHAETLTITHPAYGNAMTFRAPIDF